QGVFEVAFSEPPGVTCLPELGFHRLDLLGFARCPDAREASGELIGDVVRAGHGGFEFIRTGLVGRDLRGQFGDAAHRQACLAASAALRACSICSAVAAFWAAACSTWSFADCSAATTPPAPSDCAEATSSSASCLLASIWAVSSSAACLFASRAVTSSSIEATGDVIRSTASSA